MIFLNHYQIPRRNKNCSGNQEPLTTGSVVYSFIMETNEGLFKRMDFCEACWKSYLNTRQDISRLNYWRYIQQAVKENPKTGRTQATLNLLQEMLDEEVKAKDEIYVLTLFLQHARKLILRHEFEREGVKWGVFEIVDKDEFLTIEIIHVDHLQITPLQNSLAHKITTHLALESSDSALSPTQQEV